MPHLPLSVRFLLPALAWLLFPLAMVSAATPDPRCFELRIYTASPGKLDELHARFRDHTLALFEKHGITNIGYWTPVENAEQRLVYLLAYPSKEAREESWKQFQADPEWVKAKAASEVNGKLVAKVEQRFWQAADFSPEVKAGTAKAKRAFELRTYEATKGNLAPLLKLSAQHSAVMFKAYDIEFLGAWTSLPGQPSGENTLTYLLAYPDAAAIEATMKKMIDDPKLAALAVELEKEAGGSPIVDNGIVSLPLVPTDYSPMK